MDPYNIDSNLNKNKINNNKNKNKYKNIRIYSYNSRGFDIIKQKLCMELCEMKTTTIPILCNQENFVLKGNDHLIRKALTDFHVFIKPATKDYFDGRPINGMFIAVPKDLRSRTRDVSPQSKRIQAILFETDEDSVMIVNVYFPPDPKTKNYNLDPDLEDVLATVENLVESHHCNNVIIVGDLNTDYKRENGRVNRLDTFLSNNSFETAWNKFSVDYTHEFELDEVTYTSTIDHFLWNAELYKKVSDAGVLHLVNNTSDHSPIYCDLEKTCSSGNVSSAVKQSLRRISTKALDESDWNRFSEQLDQKLKLQSIPECMNCRDVHCTDENHTLEIDKYAKDVLETVDWSIKSVAMIKRNNICKAKIVPGWSEVVKPFSDGAKFWHAIWMSAGKPQNTTLHQIMKRTLNSYHYAIRRCKRASENIKKDKLLNACIVGKNNIFDELHKMRRVKNSIPTSIDGSERPAERFAEVYGRLYNSTNDREDTKKMLDEVEASINVKSLDEVDLVTTDVIDNVVKEIKSNKKDPVFAFNSDCIKHAPASLHHHLVNIIKSFLIHGHVSNILLVATIIPLLKDKIGNIECSDNYRSIALSNVILKIFDWIVMTLFGKNLGLDELQFSYQQNCSTTMCTWLVVESISHYSRNSSNIYTCFMDMKKAFDMVKHSMLFRKLVERNVSPIYLRLLLVMYMSQTAKVRWEGILSDAFAILNGVKQGATLSAILFCIYIDDLLKEMRRNRDGCWVNNTYVGIIVYADDIVLLSPSIDGLQNMVNTCSEYATRHNLIFSTDENPRKSKTKCMAFHDKKKDLRNIKLKGKALPWVTSVKHLGTTITNTIGCRMDQDLLEKRATYIAKNNELNQEFHYAHPKTKVWINKVFNTSFYGAPLWDMFSKNFEKLEKSWNVSNRIMLSLPRNTHRYFIEPLTETEHIIKSLWKRFLKFVGNITIGKKKVLRNLLAVIKYDARSVTGRNLRHMRLMTVNCDENELDVYAQPYQKVPESETWRVSMVQELIEAKTGGFCTNMSTKELNDICEYVCGS